MSHLARNLVLRHALDIAEEHGVPRQRLLAKLSLKPHQVDRSGGLVPTGKIIDAAELGATLSGQNNFGILLGARADYRSFGALAAMVDPICTVYDVLEQTARYVVLLNSGVTLSIAHGRGNSSFRFEVVCPSQHAPQQYIETQMLVLLTLCRLLLGSNWSPILIKFEHAQISPSATYQKAYGCDVEFNQRLNAIVATHADFEREITIAETPLHDMVQRLLNEQMQSGPKALVHQIETLLPSLLLVGKATIEQVGKALEITPRTLQRRLHEQELTFKRLVTNTRLKVADDCKRRGDTDGERLAAVLGFSDPTAASRFLRKHQS